jgi:hypothetical protein
LFPKAFTAARYKRQHPRHFLSGVVARIQQTSLPLITCPAPVLGRSGALEGLVYIFQALACSFHAEIILAYRPANHQRGAKPVAERGKRLRSYFEELTEQQGAPAPPIAFPKA